MEILITQLVVSIESYREVYIILKKRIMIFKGDIQKHGIKYALACQVIFHGEQSSLAIIKNMAVRCYYYA